MEFCPQCQERVNEFYLNRLIQDACGHKKCRKCLLNEESGCRTCSESRVTDSAVFTPYGTESSDNDHGVSLATSNAPEITTLENAIPHHTDFQDQSCELPRSPKQIAAKVSIPNKKKSIPKKSSVRSNASKCKVKRKPMLIPGYVTISESTPKFTCTLCNKSFTTRLHIRYHTYCNGLPKPFKCVKCDQEFITKSHYQYHLRNHEGSRPYACLKCGKSFNQQGKLTRHSRSHSEEKTFVCSTCGHRFKNLDGLKSHTKTHSGIKAHHCTLCKKQFAELANLKKHLVTHKGEKNFMCDECGKSFGSKSTLNTHVHTHSKVRSHICNACGRAFSLRKDLKRHETTHLPLKPFNCQLCSQAFRRRDNFDRHMKNTHPESNLPPIIKPSPNISRNETMPIASSDEQTKESIEDCDREMEVRRCALENVKDDPKSADFECESGANAKKKTLLKLSDSKLQKPKNFDTHAVNNVPKLTTESETSEAGNNIKAEKLYVRTENVTYPTSKTVAAEVKNDSPPRSAVYQAVPVINRTKVNLSSQECNVSTSSIIKMGSSLARTSYDGTNCVRTITCTSNAQMTVLPNHSNNATGTAVNVVQTEKESSTEKEHINNDQCTSKEIKPDSAPAESLPKPKLRLYLSDLHWRKRAMELLNLRNELKADSLVYDKSLEKVDIGEEANLISPVNHSERIEFCNSPKNNNSDDHGTYYSKQTFYTVSDQPGEFLVKGTQQKYLPHNRLRHIHPKSIVYHDPRPQTSFQRVQTAGVGLGLIPKPVDAELQQQQQYSKNHREESSQAKNVIVDNRIGNAEMEKFGNGVEKVLSGISNLKCAPVSRHSEG